MSSPNEVIWVTIAGRTFRATRRTVAHLEWTIARLAEKHPGAVLHLIQTCYNSGVEASAGTHDFDAVFDVWIEGLPWMEAEGFLRACGWFAWVREPPTFSLHIHMGSIPPNGRTFPQRVGIFVPGQLDDYRRGALGLAGQHDSGSDHSWRPADIDSTIFVYQEDYMATSAAEQKLDRIIAQGEASKRRDVAQTKVIKAQGNLIEALIEKVPARVTKAKREVLDAVGELEAVVGADR